MSIIEKDKKYIWHPFTQMKTSRDLIPVKSGRGAVLYDEKGREYIDAIASWWVNLHGHGHPYLAEKVKAQLLELEHVIFAGCTHQPAVDLVSRLKKHLPENQQKFFFSDNGSTSTEVALKMAIQYWFNKGKKRKRILALEHAYHGDTFGAMSASERSIFTRPFYDYLFEVSHIPFPILGKESESIAALKKELKTGEVAVFIFEPLVQGASGMQMYSPAVLQNFIDCCKEYGTLCIADEVMTGFGRTGSTFAMNQVNAQPDMLCMSKGLTGGTLPMSITSCTQEIYEAFFSNKPNKAFLHGHSFTGNPVGCAAALASLDLLESSKCQENIHSLILSNKEFSEDIRDHPMVENTRQTGTILAFDFKTKDKIGYGNHIQQKLYDYYLQNGVLLRPLGNVVYILPPYCITDVQLDRVYYVIKKSLNDLL